MILKTKDRSVLKLKILFNSFFYVLDIIPLQNYFNNAIVVNRGSFVQKDYE